MGLIILKKANSSSDGITEVLDSVMRYYNGLLGVVIKRGNNSAYRFISEDHAYIKKLAISPKLGYFDTLLIYATDTFEGFQNLTYGKKFPISLKEIRNENEKLGYFDTFIALDHYIYNKDNPSKPAAEKLLAYITEIFDNDYNLNLFLKKKKRFIKAFPKFKNDAKCVIINNGLPHVVNERSFYKHKEILLSRNIKIIDSGDASEIGSVNTKSLKLLYFLKMYKDYIYLRNKYGSFDERYYVIKVNIKNDVIRLKENSVADNFIFSKSKSLLDNYNIYFVK